MNTEKPRKDRLYRLIIVLVLSMLLAICTFITLTLSEDTELATQQKIEVSMYFPSQQYIETGDDSISRVEKELRTVFYSNEDEIVKETVKEFLSGPTFKTGANVFIGAEINDAYAIDNVAYLDFKAETIKAEGTLSESLNIESIVRTLDSLENIDSVRILLNGEEAETLSGHIDISTELTTDIYNY